MKTIEVGKPIEISEKTATLLQHVSEGAWDKIDTEVLRSAVPEPDVFLKFLKDNDLTHTAEAKIVLGRLGIQTEDPDLEGAGWEERGIRRALAKHQAAGRRKASSKKLSTLGVHGAPARRGKVAAKKKRKRKSRKLAKFHKK